MGRHALVAAAAVAAAFQGALGQQADQATAAEWDRLRERVAVLEAELAVYQLASTAGQVVCALGSENARLDGGNGTYTISSNTIASAPYGTAQVVLNLHFTEPAEIELPGLLVRIIDGMNTSTGSAFNELDADEDVPLSGEIELGDDGMDVWSPFFGTLMALTACCVIIGIAAAVEKMYMCIGGEAIHSVVEEQQRVNQKLTKIIDLVGPLVDHLDAHEDTSEVIELVTNDGQPMTTSDFMRNVSVLIGKMATPDRVASGQAKAGEAVATKIGGPKAATAIKVGEKVYDRTQQAEDTPSNRKGNRKDKKFSAGGVTNVNPMYALAQDSDAEDATD